MTTMILAVLSMVVLGSVHAQAEHPSELHDATEAPPQHSRLLVLQKEAQTEQQLLPGNQTIFGKVEAVTSDQIKVDIGEVQPRFLPLKQSQKKNFPAIKPGDDLVIIVNEQNLIVDYHPLDSSPGHHKVVRGTIAGNMPIGHDVVVIKGADGNEQ